MNNKNINETKKLLKSDENRYKKFNSNEDQPNDSKLSIGNNNDKLSEFQLLLSENKSFEGKRQRRKSQEHKSAEESNVKAKFEESVKGKEVINEVPEEQMYDFDNGEHYNEGEVDNSEEEVPEKASREKSFMEIKKCENTNFKISSSRFEAYETRIRDLKTRNRDLKTRNKELKLRDEDFQSRIKNLKSENDKLKSENTRIRSREKLYKNKFKYYNERNCILETEANRNKWKEKNINKRAQYTSDTVELFKSHEESTRNGKIWRRVVAFIILLGTIVSELWPGFEAIYKNTSVTWKEMLPSIPQEKSSTILTIISWQDDLFSLERGCRTEFNRNDTLRVKYINGTEFEREYKLYTYTGFFERLNLVEISNLFKESSIYHIVAGLVLLLSLIILVVIEWKEYKSIDNLKNKLVTLTNLPNIEV